MRTSRPPRSISQLRCTPQHQAQPGGDDQRPCAFLNRHDLFNFGYQQSPAVTLAVSNPMGILSVLQNQCSHRSATHNEYPSTDRRLRSAAVVFLSMNAWPRFIYFPALLRLVTSGGCQIGQSDQRQNLPSCSSDIRQIDRVALIGRALSVLPIAFLGTDGNPISIPRSFNPTNRSRR